jgi:DNA-binding SARP family transcriptional activator
VLFHLLGPLEVHTPTVRRLGTGKPAVLLAALLLQRNAWVPVDRLVETIWPEQDAPASAAANLQTYVWQLRRLLDGAVIEGRPGSYRIRTGPGEVDAERAAELAGAGRRCTDDDRAVELIEEALRLWRGRPLCGLDVPAEALAHFAGIRLDLREQLADRMLAQGRATDAVAVLRAAIAEAPLHEPAWARLIRALHAAGLGAEALAAYRQATRVLADELGVAPGPELAGTYRAVLAGRATRRRELPPDPPMAGRLRELAALRRPAGVALIEGMPGAGKTTLAVHAAHRMAADHPDGQFFVDLGGTLSPAAALERLLRGAGVPAADIPDDLGERSARWRSEVAGRRVLLVLDDAADGDQVRPLLPASTGARTLITTRNRGWHPPGATRIALAPLTGPDAAALLPPGAATPVVLRLCGGLPAALADVAARLRTRPQWTPRRLDEELADDPCRVFSDAVRRTLGDACRRLAGPERAVWRALADLPAEFTATAAAGVLRRPARGPLEALADRGLLEVVTADRYRAHVLVRHLAMCATDPEGGRHGSGSSGRDRVPALSAAHPPA